MRDSGSDVHTLIVDGYNAIHAWPMLRPLAEARRLEDARTRLVAMLAAYAVATGVDTTVVFDSHSHTGAEVVETVDGVTVRWGTAAATADHVIERLAHKATRHGIAHDVIVATTDRLQRDLVIAMGVGVMTTLELCHEVQRIEASTRERAESQQRAADASRRLEERIDPHTRQRLERMRRGDDEGDDDNAH